MRLIAPAVLLASLAACTSKAADDSPGSSGINPNAPGLSFVSPVDGDTVPPGALTLTFQVDNFPLVDPGAHTPENDGYIAVTYTTAGTELTEDTSQPTDNITLADTGSHAISAELFTAEGATLSPDVYASITVTVAPG